MEQHRRPKAGARRAAPAWARLGHLVPEAPEEEAEGACLVEACLEDEASLQEGACLSDGACLAQKDLATCLHQMQ